MLTTWLNLENVTLDELSHKQKDKNRMIALHEIPRVGKLLETEAGDEE